MRNFNYIPEYEMKRFEASYQLMKDTKLTFESIDELRSDLFALTTYTGANMKANNTTFVSHALLSERHHYMKTVENHVFAAYLAIEKDDVEQAKEQLNSAELLFDYVYKTLHTRTPETPSISKKTIK